MRQNILFSWYILVQFRKDINGLRAIAVIAVVLFHFNANWMPGGFAGVDVFFVISGFLMTGIIFKGIEQETFSISKFYLARANRIIPALAVLCLVLLVFGLFFLTPLDYKALGKHVLSSMTFLSNIVYWTESGYFDTASHEKWLLHTWSLSAEWQFYILYPLALIAMRKHMSLMAMRKAILAGTVIGFFLCVIATYHWANPSYYLLHTRAWEMMIGGVAYLYPLKLAENRKKAFEWLGLVLIILSYTFISKDSLWPGYLALIPVVGTFLLIQAQRNDSFVTGNIIFQYLGKWSYSIYLWHWPFVVAIFYFSLTENFIYLGILASVFLGFLSHKYIETIKFRNDFSQLSQYLKCKPIGLVFSIGLLGLIVLVNNGFLKLAPHHYQELIGKSVPSPYRDTCHIGSYQEPSKSCEYFGENISWAILGDSHAVEIAYALADKLQSDEVGLKHFSYSGCIPSYKKSADFSECSKWYNDSINYIIENDNIKNVVFNHRFTAHLLDGNADNYTDESEPDISREALSLVEQIDELISLLASKKDNVYIFYPIPELPKPINQLIDNKLHSGESLDNIVGTSLNWYKNRNVHMIRHFNNSKYPDNVHLINPEKIFCDQTDCYAVKDGVPLYFDDDHPSILGAFKLVEMIEISN
ncbi:acyltransferase family protein [Thalassotalea maritima]|uniref:acyltransferase family protein n=1 Tax=Thalassotalea maritima TaxID=3242416 RepID=UPI003526D88A